MTIPTQIPNQPLVSHMFLTFQINTRQSFAASATAVRVVATIHELQPIGGPRGAPFKSEVIRLKSAVFVPKSASLCSPGLHFHHAFCAQLLPPQQSRIQVTHATYTTARGHCPSSRRVRSTHHFERQPIFHHSTKRPPARELHPS